MEIKKLNEHYSITRPSTVYDEEALTTLELVGRTTAKVNEVVDAQNALHKATNEHLEKQDTKISEAVSEQNNTISDAIKAQNQHITTIETVTMPNKVTTEVQRKINSGEFSEEVDRYYNNLSRRIDNLANLSEGSTSGDAELIDGRVDAGGAVHTNIGANIRNTQNNINGLLNPDILTTVDAPIKHTDYGYNDYNAVWHGDEYGDYVCVVIAVKPGEIYFLRGSASGTTHPLACVTNSNGSLIRSYHGATGYNTIPSNYDKYVIIPPGGANLLINSYAVGSMISDPGAKKVVGFNSVKEWEHLKWACLGDSLTEKNQRTTKNYHDYISEKTGISVVNLGVSGSGYIAGGDNAFYKRYSSIPADCDVITIFGSGNDIGQEIGNPTDTSFSTVCGCMNYLLNNLYEGTDYAGKPVGVISPTPWTNHTPDNDECYLTRYVEAMKEICTRRGIPFLDLYHLSGFKANDLGFTHMQYFDKDPDGTNIHPNEAGHKIIASHIYNFLNSLIGTY